LDADIKNVGPEKNLSEQAIFETEQLSTICLTNTAMKWGVKHKDALPTGLQKHQLDN